MAKIISVVGATGNVGRIVISQLMERGIAPTNIRAMASAQSAGKTLDIAGHLFQVQAASEEAMQGSVICIFNTEADVSAQLVPAALKNGAYVVDSSSHYRLQQGVSLIVPTVNAHQITKEQKLYAHANCLVSPIATVIAPIHQALGIHRVEAVTYQSTSGAGKGPMDECWDETNHMVQGKQYQRQHFSRQIAFNVIPQVGSIGADGFTSEERKIINETRKVVGDIKVTATAVRVPVLRGHSIALSIECNNPAEVRTVKSILQNARWVKLSDKDFTTPVEVVGSDDVYVGRIRINPATTNGIQMWLCSDNLRRGAATDAVDIATALLQVM